MPTLKEIRDFTTVEPTLRQINNVIATKEERPSIIPTSIIQQSIISDITLIYILIFISILNFVLALITFTKLHTIIQIHQRPIAV
jgi:hypothetical protein